MPPSPKKISAHSAREFSIKAIYSDGTLATLVELSQAAWAEFMLIIFLQALKLAKSQVMKGKMVTNLVMTMICLVVLVKVPMMRTKLLIMILQILTMTRPQMLKEKVEAGVKVMKIFSVSHAYPHGPVAIRFVVLR